MLNVLIRDAVIVDGSNSPRYRGDVGVEGDRIAAIGALGDAEARTVIDASGRVVVPGFIDMHSHADLSLPIEPAATSLVRQGITTVVTGQCGVSPAPLTREHRQDTLRTLGMLIPPEASMPWDRLSSFGSFLDYLEGLEIPVNVVALVGQGMVRAAVMGYRAGPPSEREIAQMQRLVHEALDRGAFGLSTGLIYPPGSFSSTVELVEVARPVGERGSVYFSHIRGEGATLLEALVEAIEIGRQSGAAVQIGHFKAAGRDNWDRAAMGLELIARARGEGLDVTADMYPYTGGATYLAAALPEWALEGGTPGLLHRLERPEERARILEAMGEEEGVAGKREWDKVLITGSAHRQYVGYSVEELAGREGKDPAAWILDTLHATVGRIGMLVLSQAEENLRMQMGHPAMMFGTDGMGVSAGGPMALGIAHPRYCGTYPRIFGRYVREQDVLSLEAASWKASGFPAQKLGLADRGLIQEGFRADLVVFDPAAIEDRATFKEPLRYPVGIDHVLVNGEVVVERGEQTDARPGGVIRRGS